VKEDELDVVPTKRHRDEKQTQNEDGSLEDDAHLFIILGSIVLTA
jgi:hypothetical protein